MYRELFKKNVQDTGSSCTNSQKHHFDIPHVIVKALLLLFFSTVKLAVVEHDT